jgi:hypothetical protein
MATPRDRRFARFLMVEKLFRKKWEADPAGPMSVEEIPLNNGNASELARTIYVVFEKRASLQKNSVNGLPGLCRL